MVYIRVYIIYNNNILYITHFRTAGQFLVNMASINSNVVSRRYTHAITVQTLFVGVKTCKVRRQDYGSRYRSEW